MARTVLARYGDTFTCHTNVSTGPHDGTLDFRGSSPGLSRLTLDPPCLEAWCHLRGAERAFTPSRIRSVMGVAPG
ncbi:hypothetical protein [Streptomyces sp. AB3(2024)]|uniref:hypothetical protein n=1 Tax=Streptomyces sp. AB3(2024) TaxID=3317321 RepID=UPI0035A3CE6F